ncbi:ABC transporter permease, partial [Staphylococcus capitis]
LDWVAHAFTGDLGYSFSTREPVTSMIIQSLTPTLTLMVIATAILLPLGFAIGYVVGVNPGHKWRIMLRSIAQILTSMPEYWLAILF